MNTFEMGTFPVEWNPTWDRLDSTKLQSFASCPRAFFYEYVLGWRSERPNNHLHFGVAIHKALEHLLLAGYSANSAYAAYETFLDEYRRVFDEDTDELYSPKIPDNVLVVLGKYIGRYADDLSKFDILQTETAGTVPIGKDKVMWFKMDAILRDKVGGFVYGLEHKTAGGKWQWEMQWPLKIQIGTYTHALYCLHFDEIEKVKGILVNGLFFDKRRKDFQKAQSSDLFSRCLVTKSPQQMRAWLSNVNYWWDCVEYEYEELSCARANDPVLRAFPMNSESCTKYNGCPYHDFCCTWPNPLQQAHEPPMGFQCEFWDPGEEATKATNQVELEWDGGQ